VAVRIDCFAKEGFGLFPRQGQPVSGHKFSRIGVRIGEGKNPASEILKPVKRAILVDDQVGMVEMASFDLRGGEQFEAVLVFAGGVGSRTDKSKINLSLAKKFVDLIIGFTLDELGLFAGVTTYVIENLTIIDGGLFGGDHSPDCNPEITVSRWPLTRPGHMDSMREINYFRVTVATAARANKEKNEEKPRQGVR
jgi:hypothetical protein